MELMEDRLRIFRINLVARQSLAHTLSFKYFRRCGAPDLFGVKDPIVASRWIIDIDYAQMTSFYPEGLKFRFVVGCLRVQAKIGRRRLAMLWEICPLKP